MRVLRFERGGDAFFGPCCLVGRMGDGWGIVSIGVVIRGMGFRRPDINRRDERRGGGGNQYGEGAGFIKEANNLRCRASLLMLGVFSASFQDTKIDFYW